MSCLVDRAGTPLQYADVFVGWHVEEKAVVYDCVTESEGKDICCRRDIFGMRMKTGKRITVWSGGRRWRARRELVEFGPET